jgi:hypothetical protein
MGRKAIQLSQRAQALAFWQAKLPLDETKRKTDLRRQTIQRIQKCAIERGQNPKTIPVLKDPFVQDNL